MHWTPPFVQSQQKMHSLNVSTFLLTLRRKCMKPTFTFFPLSSWCWWWSAMVSWLPNSTDFYMFFILHCGINFFADLKLHQFGGPSKNVVELKCAFSPELRACLFFNGATFANLLLRLDRFSVDMTDMQHVLTNRKRTHSKLQSTQLVRRHINKWSVWGTEYDKCHPDNWTTLQQYFWGQKHV